ncbi:hypothetical protein H6G76_02470 [Nostoc sp. FACHB-152]|uniref:hypothetical protein n=1 Tax=unclassified Nostoc TaxID=2593658 RepID=UPI00168906A8|nr:MULTISPECIES: hypothetical protein [unclassified Nostoc]MBD2446037.1 hypothetical protein [Nostoc sp. FACHB-152]MBD2467269.1 hypothetical protein [Nostoc sp. FACHB-145]
MSLPFILDVTIGLAFIYLILSLLASEIQELITTILQWRAVHLKKSIEILIAGDVSKSDDNNVLQLVNDLYNHPLIQSVNQEAKGFLTTLPRKFIWLLSYIPVMLSLTGEKRKKSIFGYVKNGQETTNKLKHSAPSYIPAETFATTLMDTLGLPTLVDKLTESRLINFADEQLHEIQNVLLRLQERLDNSDDHICQFLTHTLTEFNQIVEGDFRAIIANFQKDKADLYTTINRMAKSLDRYISSFEAEMPEHELINKSLQRLKFLRQDTFDDIEQTICLKALRPNINEIVQLINVGSEVQQEFVNEFKNKDSEAYQIFQDLIQRLEYLRQKLPPSVVGNMAILARRAQMKAKSTEEGINILRREIEQTFNNSMERASGVYKRNAKGVALLIGFAIAIIANADTLHIVNRLSKDTAIRTAIVNNAGEIVQTNSTDTKENLRRLRDETDQVLTTTALPIGWNDTNLDQQLGNRKKFIPFTKYLTMAAGWFISGIAISMGAPFWFDLLSKIVNVRNSGKKPAASTHEQETEGRSTY